MVPVVSAFCLLVLPLLWVATIRGWWGRSRARRLLWLGILAILGLSAPWMPWNPTDASPHADLRTIKLIVLVVVLSVMAAWCAGLPWARDRTRRIEVWTVLTLVAVPVFYNCFYFHGVQIFVHRHDLGHYYFGAKYFEELGYTGLYTAILRAEAEIDRGHFLSRTARDLETYEIVDIRVLLEKSGAVKARFTPERWDEFKRDTAHLRKRLGGEYLYFVSDHGFNPPPTWVLMARFLARSVPAGSNTGLLALALLDLVLLVLSFCAIAKAFRAEAMLLALLHFLCASGAGFEWTGGGFLRFAWYFGVAAGVACLHRRRHAWAGVLLAFATMMRIFPGILVAPLAIKALAVAWRRGRPAARHVRFFVAAGATVISLFAASLTLPEGLDHWRDFEANLSTHMEDVRSSVVGLTEALAFRPNHENVTYEDFVATKERSRAIREFYLLVMAVPLVWLLVRLSPRRTDLGAVGLGVMLLYFVISLAAYYWIVLLVLVLLYRSSPRSLLLIFAAEVVPNVMSRFPIESGTIYVCRGLVLLLLFATLLWRDHRTGARRHLRTDPDPDFAESPAS